MVGAAMEETVTLLMQGRGSEKLSEKSRAVMLGGTAIIKVGFELVLENNYLEATFLFQFLIKY